MPSLLTAGGRCLLTFRLFLDGLLESCDVPEGAEEQDDNVPLVLHRTNLKQEPQWSSWKWR